MGIGRQLFNNILTSWLSYAVRLVIGFAFLPFIASTFGSQRYGVWVIIFQAITYLSLFDLGLERAVIRFTAKYYAQQDYRSLSRTLGTSQRIFILLSPLVLAGVTVVSLLLFDGLKLTDPSVRHEGQIALIIIGFLLASKFSLGVINHALAGLQRFDLLNALDIFEEIFRYGFMALLLYQGLGMVALASAIIGVNLVRQAIGYLLLRHYEPNVRWSPANFDRERFRELYRYSRMSFGITLAWLVIFNSDSILLGLLSSTAAAGIYAPAAQLMLYMRHVVNAIGIPLTPAISHLDARDNDGGIVQTYLTGLKYVSFVSFLLSAGVVIFARSFVALWLPPEFAKTADVMIILSIGSAVFLPQIIGNSVLFGIERHRYLFYVLACEAVLKVGLSFILIKDYGSSGMAVAAAAPQVLLYLTLYPYFMSRVLSVPMSKLLVESWRSGLLALVVTIPVALGLRYLIAPTNWPAFFIDVLLVAAVALTFGYLVIMNVSDKQRIIGFVLRRT